MSPPPTPASVGIRGIPGARPDSFGGLSEPFTAPCLTPKKAAKEKAVHYGIGARPPVKGYKSHWWAATLNLWGSISISFDEFATFDTLTGVGLSIIYVLCYWQWGQHLAINMSWNVVSMGVIFPITNAIGMGFKRREQALSQFGNMLGNLRAIWGAVHGWNIQNSEKKWVRMVEELGPDGAARVESLFDEFLTSLVIYFNGKRWKRARHSLNLQSGMEEQAELQQIAHEQHLVMDACVARMQRLVQFLKKKGLPGGEAHRLDQYVSKVSIAVESLCFFKEYRTPQGFRAFARIYIQCMGALYGPYFVYLAKGSNEESSNVGLAIVYAVSMQLTMSG